MNKKIKQIIIWSLIVIALAVSTYFLSTAQNQPGKYDTFAACIKNSGAIFYGAFWCPHCQNQKAMFGNSARLLPYVECSAPDGQSQTQVCINKQIKAYPTWVFKDGSRLSGEIPFKQLAEKTGCELPKQ